METKSKSWRYFLIMMIIALLLAAGWLVAKTRTGILNKLPFTGISVTLTTTITPSPTPM